MLHPWERRAEFTYRRAVPYIFQHVADRFSRPDLSGWNIMQQFDPLKTSDGRRYTMKNGQTNQPVWKIEAASFVGNGLNCAVFVRDARTDKVVAIIERPKVMSFQTQPKDNMQNFPSYHIWLPIASFEGQKPLMDEQPPFVAKFKEQGHAFYIHARVSVFWEGEGSSFTPYASYTVFQSNKGKADRGNFAHEMTILKTELQDDSGSILTQRTMGKSFCCGGKTWKVWKPWHPSLFANPPKGDVQATLEITDDQGACLNVAELLNNDPDADMDRLRLFLNAFCIFDSCLARKAHNMRRAEACLGLATTGLATACYAYNQTPDALLFDGYLILSQALYTGVGAAVGSAYTAFQVGKFYLYGAEAMTRTVHAVGAEPYLPAVGAAGGSIYLANNLLVEPILKPAANVIVPLVKPIVEPVVAGGMELLTKGYERFFRPGGGTGAAGVGPG
eukprot:g12076.t1